MKGNKIEARQKVSETWKLIKDLRAGIDYNLVSKAKKLKEAAGIFVVAHTYQRLEVKEIADVIGDSFALASAARTLPQGKKVLHCSVDFMAETTKILRPDLEVIVPSLYGGCGLADYITGEQIREWKRREAERLSVSPDETPLVLYINSYADAKAEADVICTSSNALKVVESLPEKNVLFAPDRNLCYSITLKTTKNLIPWEGTCPIHVEFTREMIESAIEGVERESEANIGVMVHPECNPDVLDYVKNELECVRAVLSTGGMLSFAKAHPEIGAWVAGTEIGLIESP
ncbi:MAG: quinolinate synthase NadA, partial [Deltaproteobacteria bacterium]|nr:quinolinate synthase NadA [Deltaproteobacteria bacterium]